MISKELLCEVLDLDENGYYKSKVAKVFIKDNKVIENWIREDFNKEINIHELAYKCKKYFAERGYLISELSKYVLIAKDGVALKRINNDFYEDGEIDWSDIFDVRSIFKACQWILDKGK